MRATTAICLFLLSACDGAPPNTSEDSGTAADGGSTGDDAGATPADAGSTGDSGALDTGTRPVTCDPDFGQAGACGGDLSGVWNYRAACGRTPIASALEQRCPSAVIRAERFEGGRGTLTVSGVSFALDVSVEVHVEATLPAACTFAGCAATQAALQQALPRSTVSCTSATAGCDCTFDGPVGSASNGTVTTSGGIATVDGQDSYYYCAEGGSLVYRQFGTGVDEPIFVLDR